MSYMLHLSSQDKLQDICHKTACCDTGVVWYCRWFSSILNFMSFQHVLSNMLLFVVLSWQIEEKYGAWRVAFIFFWSALGGETVTATLGC